jgi:hypothetical protein
MLLLTTTVAFFLAWGIVQAKYLGAENEKQRLQSQLDSVVGMMRSWGYSVNLFGSGASMSSKPVDITDPP